MGTVNDNNNLEQKEIIPKKGSSRGNSFFTGDIAPLCTVFFLMFAMFLTVAKAKEIYTFLIDLGFGEVLSEFIMIVLGVILGALISYISLKYFFAKVYAMAQSPKKSELEEAFKLMRKGGEQNTLTPAAIRLIYDNMVSTGDSPISYIDFLGRYIIHIRIEDNDGSLTRKNEELIYEILEKEKAEKPYSGINEGERRILLAILSSAQEGHPNSVKKYLEDLSIIIEQNQKALDKAERTNRWAKPTSFIGIFLTILFGILGLIGTSLSNKDVERISREVSSSVKDSINAKIIIENTTTLDTLGVKQ